MKLSTFRMALHLAAVRDYNITGIDVSTAFLYGDIDCHVYMRMPPGLPRYDAEGYELTIAGATVHGAFTRLEALQDGLRKQGWTVTEWGHVWTPLTSLRIDDRETAQQCLKLLDALEALDDVRSVSANLELDPELQVD